MFDKIVSTVLLVIALVCAWLYMGKPTTTTQVIDKISKPASAAVVEVPTARVTVSSTGSSGTVILNREDLSAPQPTAAPTQVVERVTSVWADGSMSYNDGTPIDEAHGKPGYCQVTRLPSGVIQCSTGEIPNYIAPEFLDPELVVETATPWSSQPVNGATFQAVGNACTVRYNGEVYTFNFDNDASSECSYMAARVEEGTYKPGVQGGPKG